MTAATTERAPFSTSFVVYLDPQGKGMPRAFKNKAGGVSMHKHTGTAKYERHIAEAAEDYFPETPLDGPLGIRVLSVVKRPKSLSERWGRDDKKKGRVKGEPKHDPGLIWHLGKPDADKVLYAVMDALAPYIFNDSRFCDTSAVKAYAELDGRPRLEVSVWTCPGTGPVEIPEEDSNELWEALDEAQLHIDARLGRMVTAILAGAKEGSLVRLERDEAGDLGLRVLAERESEALDTIRKTKDEVFHSSISPELVDNLLASSLEEVLEGEDNGAGLIANYIDTVAGKAERCRAEKKQDTEKKDKAVNPGRVDRGKLFA